jgi:hypothetical protein
LFATKQSIQKPRKNYGYVSNPISALAVYEIPKKGPQWGDNGAIKGVSDVWVDHFKRYPLIIIVLRFSVAANIVISEKFKHGGMVDTS